MRACIYICVCVDTRKYEKKTSIQTMILLIVEFFVNFNHFGFCIKPSSGQLI